MDPKFLPYMLAVVTIYSAIVTLMCLTGAKPDVVKAPTCQPVYVVSAGEYGLCESVCKYRTRSGVKEIWRGEHASLNCVCDGAVVTIDGKTMGRGL